MNSYFLLSKNARPSFSSSESFAVNIDLVDVRSRFHGEYLAEFLVRDNRFISDDVIP